VADQLAKEGADAPGAEYLSREESIASLRLPMWPAALQKRNGTSTSLGLRSGAAENAITFSGSGNTRIQWPPAHKKGQLPVSTSSG
jgi:hypothetical protein